MPRSVRIAWCVSFFFALLAGAIVAHPPAWFGARLDFLLYQRGGLAPGTAVRFATSLAIAAAAFALIASGRAPRAWSRGRDKLASAPWLYFAGMAAIFVIASGSYAAMLPFEICRTPDSASYLDFGALRTIGYPLFLRIVLAADPSGGYLVLAQSLFLLSGLGALAHALAQLCEDRLAGLAAFALFAGNASLAGYAGAILAETPFVALLSFHLATIASLCRRFGWRMAIFAGLTLGGAVLMRPAGYAFFGALPAFLLLLASRRLAGTLVIAAAAALPLLGAAAVNQARHGFFATQEQGGYSLLGFTAHLISPGMTSEFSGLPARIAAKTEPYRARIEAAGFPFGAWRVAMSVYNPQLYEVVLPEIDAWIAERPASDRPDIAAVAAGLAREAVRHDPAGYARQIAAQYFGLWLLSFLPQGPMAERMAACAAMETAGAGAPKPTPVDLFWAVVTLGQFLYVGLGVVACWLAIPSWFAAAGWCPARRFAIYAALGVNAYFLGFATTQVALPRYSVVVEPWLIALLVVLAAASARRWTESQHRDGPPADRTG